ncbi:MAG TPA: class I SAM-dependent methyltransferase [Acidimicrobiales bacterium]|nr:class I SAM-dependent methyltransferase [Acidimicrobiales bacterium]
MSEEHWSGERVRLWLAQAERLDRQLVPVSRLLFEGAALRAGERVLDVGCGAGPTTRAAAEAVGREGRVAGIDVSAEMLDAARGVPTAAGAAPIDWIKADVATWAPQLEPVHVVISRFGVMFFDDPAAAFANLAAATTPEGRLCAMVWDRRDRSQLFQVPLAVATEVLTALGQPPEVPPVDEAAFSLHDPAHVVPLLEGSGWRDVTHEPLAIQVHLGGGLTPAQASEVALGVGPSRVVMTGIDDDARRQVLDAMAVALADHVDPDGHVVLGASVVRLTARRG